MTRRCISLFLASCAIVHADEALPAPSDAMQTAIHGKIDDGARLAPSSLPAPLEFKVQSSFSRRMLVEKPSELPDLPPVTGNVRVTVQRVEDPHLPAPVEPLPPLPANDPAVYARITGAKAEFRDMSVLFVSASVYESKTLLKCYPGGVAEAEVTAVSNLDFNDFSGFASFQVKSRGSDGLEETRQYALVMALGRFETAASFHQAIGDEARVLPEPPHRNSGPGYVITKGNEPMALQAIADLHELYRIEGEKMRAARIAREHATQERKVFLLANPPRPKDITIRYWTREPSEKTPESANE